MIAKNIRLASLLVIFFCIGIVKVQGSTTKNELIKNTWYVWSDSSASWQNDKLFINPPDLHLLNQNLPTCGWAELFNNNSTEYQINNNGKDVNSLITNGVNWLYTSIKLEPENESKITKLRIGALTGRCEVFFNKQFVAYNIDCQIPFDIDVTSLVKYDAENEIAIRITYPFKHNTNEPFNTEWNIFEQFSEFPKLNISEIYMLEYSMVSIDDVYAVNQSTYNSIVARITLTNNFNKNVDGKLIAQIFDSEFNLIAKNNNCAYIPAGRTIEIEIPISAENVKLWNTDDPRLYKLVVELLDKEKNEESIAIIELNFGFRLIENSTNDNSITYKLNGEKIILNEIDSLKNSQIITNFSNDVFNHRLIDSLKIKNINTLNISNCNLIEDILNKTDEEGLLTYIEPNISKTINVENKPFLREFEKNRFLQMSKLYRNHPSLIIFKSINSNDISDANEINQTQLFIPK